MNKNSNDDSKLPVNNRCQYLLFKHVMTSEESMTTYELMKYGRTLDMCACFGMTYNSVRRLVDRWYGQGLIDLVPAYEDADMKYLRKKRKGIDVLDRLRWLFDDPA